jgi:tRNA threonylcarbamoyladenosine biosynthesis protein TsaE
LRAELEESARTTKSPDETYSFGRWLAGNLRPGDLVLLEGGLGAGKTLLTKGVLEGLAFDPDEVTSPSFALVNLYRTPTVEVYHVDLWRIESGRDPTEAVGLEEILESGAITIVEWADRLGDHQFANRTLHLTIEGDGDDPRRIRLRIPADNAP